MLTVTDNAQSLVKGLTENADLPETGGVRLAMAPDQAQLTVSLVTEPEDTDQVVDSGEARIYVAEDAAEALDGHALDATQTPDGVGFTLQTPQG
ncbi:MAG: Fe-S cluster assembly protein HesB [Dermatophilaceae bacterium]